MKIIYIQEKKEFGQYKDFIVGENSSLFRSIVNKPYITEEQIYAFETLGIHCKRIEGEKDKK